MTDGDDDLERWVTQRAAFLTRATVLSQSEAEAVAYSERGFSDSGIAHRVDATAGTVTNYLDRAVARFGPEVRHSRPDPDADRELTPVGGDKLAEWPAHYRETWQEALEHHPDYEPPAITEANRRAAETAADGGQEATHE